MQERNILKTVITTLALGAILAVSAWGQGFANLDFESAYDLPGNPGNGLAVAVTNALPGWTAYVGAGAMSYIYYVSNSSPGGGYNTVVELEGGSLALSGDFSVGLFQNGSISQTAVVPDDAESLQFEADSPINVVSLGGQDLFCIALSHGADYDVYGANIPADMDGQLETLTFGIQGPGEALLDNIEFSSSVVPEPGEWSLIGIGAMVFGVYCLRSRLGRGQARKRIV